jgi:hypothetical protein
MMTNGGPGRGTDRNGGDGRRASEAGREEDGEVGEGVRRARMMGWVAWMAFHWLVV